MSDHSNEIQALQMEAERIRARETYPSQRWCQAKTDEVADQISLAAELLELHDATGISLDNWPTARRVVERAVSDLTYDGCWTLTENHV